MSESYKTHAKYLATGLLCFAVVGAVVTATVVTAMASAPVWAIAAAAWAVLGGALVFVSYLLGDLICNWYFRAKHDRICPEITFTREPR